MLFLCQVIKKWNIKYMQSDKLPLSVLFAVAMTSFLGNQSKRGCDLLRINGKFKKIYAEGAKCFSLAPFSCIHGTDML